MTSTTDIQNIWQYDLRKGNSQHPRDGACLLDAVSYFEYGTLGDHPPCVCPVIAAFGRGINDAMSDAGRQRLKEFLPRLPGTVDPASEQARAEYLAWQEIRVFAPIALDAAGLYRHGQALREFRGTLKEAAAAADSAARAAAYAANHADLAADSAAHAARAAAARASYASYASYTSYTSYTAAAAADTSKVEAAMIDAFNGVLAIGRQAEPIIPARWQAAQRKFSLAAGL